MPPCKGISVHGVMIPMKRERMLTIRVTDDEHARLLERCEGKQLAVWMRRVCRGAGCPFREAADTGTAVTASAGRHRK